ncbi:uroporphyrinogen-III synthase [Defluviimonas sp. WL0050]|uniref:Uroporphyrinogen-III synthase n=1 Tax=Albidovulum litorale TaxID=2984134 RepID=A0ABT2ZP22_9RHOB|nr:uroporphyrinogen-III synthase [Defluviimonas sp. WL0050]MCV2872725.1 uroporphyrinogen-III synthase [Defluviimonas sp. WL0050]
MDQARPTLLLTRPEAQSRRFAQAFRDRFGADWPVVMSPLTEIRTRDPGPIPPETDGVIFTSQNAVTAYAALTPRRDAIAWCVGDRTAEAARSAGFSVQVGPGDAAGLVNAIKARNGGTRYMFPRGVHVARDVAAELNSAGIETVSVIVYEQLAVAPTPQAEKLLASPEAVLLPLFSPRSARIAAERFAGCAAHLRIAAMSDAVAEAAADLNPGTLRIATHPDGSSMLDALAALIAAPNIA